MKKTMQWREGDDQRTERLFAEVGTDDIVVGSHWQLTGYKHRPNANQFLSRLVANKKLKRVKLGVYRRTDLEAAKHRRRAKLIREGRELLAEGKAFMSKLGQALTNLEQALEQT